MNIFFRKIKLVRSGFTLLEILLGGVILAVVSMNVYQSFENFSRAGIRAQDRMIAMSTTNTIFEQIRRQVESQPNLFDQIEMLSTDWIAADVPNYPQGYFESRITTRRNTPQIGIAQVVVEIRWQDQSGVTQQRARNVFNLSEPGQFVFGNIVGTVYDCRNSDNHLPVANATVRVHEAPAGLEWIIGTITQTDANGFYSFRGQDNRNILPIGDGYRLMGVSPGLRSTIAPAQAQPAINLPEVPDVEQDICLVDANVAITGRLVRANDHSQGIAGKSVSLRRAGNSIRHATTNAQGRFQFNLTEDDGMQGLEPGDIRCFTVATGGPFSDDALERSFPYWHAYVDEPSYVGDFCGSNDRRGWSSAVMGNNPLNPSCDGNRPWFGNSASEDAQLGRSVCVSIGTNADIGIIPLRVLPNESVTINATVNAPAGTQRCSDQGYISISWGSSLGSWSYRNQWRSVSGNSFSLTTAVPPIHNIVSNPTGNNRMRVSAYVSQSIPGCCGGSTCQGRWSNTVSFNPSETNTINLTINLDPSAGQSCGGAYGEVYSLWPEIRQISGGTVSCGISVSFSSNGNWRIQCSDGTLDRLSRGSRHITASHSNFYTRSTSSAWPYQSIPLVNIQGGETFTRRPRVSNGYDIGLYPIGYGHITGRVVDQEDGTPIPGATVVFRRYGSTDNGEVTTDAQGNFTLTNRIESWPPGGSINNIPENARSEMTSSAQTHSLRVTATVDGQTQTVTRTGVRVDAGVTRNEGNIEIFFPTGGPGGGI